MPKVAECLGTRAGVIKVSKGAVQGTFPSATVPARGKLPGKDRKPGDPSPAPQGPAASPENERALCALNCLQGLPSNHFFPGDISKGSLPSGARVDKLPQAPSASRGRRGGTSARCRRLLLPQQPGSLSRPWRTVTGPPASASPAGCRQRARTRIQPAPGPDQDEGSPWPAPPPAWGSDRRLCRSS